MAPSISFLNHLCSLNINSNPEFIRLSGIVCTIGPASKSPVILEEMLTNGMNIARLNFSHGTHKYHSELIQNIRLAVQNYSRKIGMQYSLAIALDTKGSEIRTGLLEGGSSAEVELAKEDSIRVTTDLEFSDRGSKGVIFIDYSGISNVVLEGSRIFIDDGLISLICKRVEGNDLICEVENGGKLGSSKGVHLPGVTKNLSTISVKDKSDLNFAIDQSLDLIFASFTCNAAEIRQIRQIVGPKMRIIAKIENQQGIDHMDEIIEASDGILIDRGDLGMEIGFQKVFLAQKIVIGKCNKANKPIIIATHMLESMVEKPRPTRAESTDVANTILDGADCLVLAGETAKGLYPIESVKTMAKICREAEAALWQKRLFLDLTKDPMCTGTEHALAIAIVRASLHSQAKAILVVTETGKSAQLISKYRPKCPIVAITKDRQIARQLHLYRAVFPVYFKDNFGDGLEDINASVKFGITFGKRLTFLKDGDLVIIVTGWKQGSGYTNTFRAVVVNSKQ